MAVSSKPAQTPTPGADGGGIAPSHDPYPGGYVVQAPSVPAGEPVLVPVRAGLLQGVRAGGVNYFRGIAYAEPPLGALRFRRARPPQPWRGVRAATVNPRAPLQTGFLAEALTSEDCLYLNIWAPAAPGPHPVYVYIHGGANNSGYALEHRVQGAHFARDGIVCVNIGYRVGAFGFLELGALLGEAYHVSANNDLHDQLLALQWVQDNIAAFGGDPQQVTIGGQSAGGFNVCSLLASPLAKGLFRAAISQSGSGHHVSTLAMAQATAERFAQALQAQGDAVADLPTLAAERILAAERASIPMGVNNGVIDGELLLEHPYQAARLGRNAQVKLLIGANRDETLLFGPPPVRASFTAAEQDAFARYQALHPQDSEAVLLGRFSSECLMGGPSMVYAEQHALAGGQSFVYRWSLGAPNGRFAGLAIHGLETPFVWDNVGALAFRYITPDATLQALAQTVHQCWVSFICDGQPAASTAPHWPAWTASQKNYFDIDAVVQMSIWPDDELALWSAVLQRV